MDPPLLTLSVAVIFVLCSVIVESQRIADRPPPLVFSPRPPSHPRPPPSPPFVPSRPLRPRPPPRRHTRLHLPPAHRRHDPHMMKPPPPRRKPSLNLGKKIGLMFIGVAVVLQVCVVGFLLISRRRFLKQENSL